MKSSISALILYFASLTHTNVFTQVTDIDGNIYNTLEIGCQIWMAENLRVTKYNNGDSIRHFPGFSEWNNATEGAWCFYDNDILNDSIYGKLYNWYAISDPRNICPAGWHVSIEKDWEDLKIFLGGSPGSDIKSTGLISAGTGLWNGSVNNATNETGFTALPAGYRFVSFYSKGNTTYFTTPEILNNGAVMYSLTPSSTQIDKRTLTKDSGASVRCIKNKPSISCDSSIHPVVSQVHFYPETLRNVVGGEKILDIKFNKPMNTQAVTNAFSLGVAENDQCYRTRSGFFNWITQSHVQLKAYGEEGWFGCILHADSSYTLSIDTTAISLDTKKLQSKFEINFKTAPILSQESIADSLRYLYLDKFGLDIEQPVWYTNDFGTKAYHTSTVYHGDSLIRVFMLADGTTMTREYQPTLFPKDTIRVAALTVDYGNSNISEIFNSIWVPAMDTFNILHQQYAVNQGFDEPVLQFNITNFLIPYSSLSHPWPRTNSQSANFTEKNNSVVAVLNDNGYTEDDFDLYALFDIDTEYTKGGVYLGKLVYVGWYYGSTDFYSFTPEDTKPYFFMKTMFDHEIGHAMGWGHVWSARYLLNGSGTTSNSHYDFQTFPQLYGWTDTNCNGIPEIKESLPYRASIKSLTNAVISNNPDQTLFRSNVSIISDAILEGNKNFELHALERVELLPNFELVSPATLLIQMDGCRK